MENLAARVVVTYLPEEKNRQVLTDALGDVAQVCFAAEAAGPRRAELLASADVLIGLSFSEKEFSAEEAPLIRNARLVQAVYAGVDKVPFDRLGPGTAVAANAGAYSGPIAEHVLALALALAKSIVPRHREMGDGIFDRKPRNRVLKGGLCGIIGLGGNGAAVAGLMGSLGMRVWGINRTGRTDAPVSFIGTPSDLKAVLEAADLVVVTAPLTRRTYHLIDAERLSWMKPDALLINVGRGAIIAEKELYDHLCTHPAFGAGIDTWWAEPPDGTPFRTAYPFFDLPNLVGSPHNADHVPGIATEATRMAAANVRNFLQGRSVRGVVDPGDYIAKSDQTFLFHENE